MTNLPAHRSKPEDVKKAISVLFQSFPSQHGGNKDGQVAAYIEVAQGFPPGVVEMAVRKFIYGKVANHDGRFLPTCAELAKVMSAIVDAQIADSRPAANVSETLYRREQDKQFDNRTAEQKERMKKRVAAVMADMENWVSHDKVMFDKQGQRHPWPTGTTFDTEFIHVPGKEPLSYEEWWKAVNTKEGKA